MFSIRFFKPLFIFPISSRVFYFNSTCTSDYFLKRPSTFDNFGITKCETMQKLLNNYHDPKLSKELNEILLICFQITQLSFSMESKTIDELPKTLLQKTEIDIINEDTLIGPLLVSLKLLYFDKNVDQWFNSLDLIKTNCITFEDNEILKALKSSNKIEELLEEKWQKQLFKRIVEKMELMIGHLKNMRNFLNNIKGICQICQNFEVIEAQIIKFIRWEYESRNEIIFELEDLIEFSYCFVKIDYFSPNLLNFINEILLKRIKTRKILKLEGSKIAHLIHCWK